MAENYSDFYSMAEAVVNCRATPSILSLQCSTHLHLGKEQHRANFLHSMRETYTNLLVCLCCHVHDLCNYQPIFIVWCIIHLFVAILNETIIIVNSPTTVHARIMRVNLPYCTQFMHKLRVRNA